MSRVESIFRVIRARVRSAFPFVGVNLVLDESAYDPPRHYAFVPDGSREVHVSARLGDLPDANIAGVLWHEFGHVLDDWAWPQLRGLGLPPRWSEARADALVEELLGVVIRYDPARRYLQTTGRGVTPRPRGLR